MARFKMQYCVAKNLSAVMNRQQSRLKVHVSTGEVTAEVAVEWDSVVQSKLRGRLRRQRSHSHMQQKKRQRQSDWQTKLSGEPCRNKTRGIWPQLWLHPPQHPGDLRALCSLTHST